MNFLKGAPGGCLSIGEQQNQLGSRQLSANDLRVLALFRPLQVAPFNEREHVV